MGNEGEGGVRNESQISNLVHSLILGVRNKKKILEMGGHEHTFGYVENEVSSKLLNGDFNS